MEAKDKAKKLVDKFYQTTPNECWINQPLEFKEEYKAWKQSKQCALIAVDEIIEILWHTHKNEIEYRYWQEVKQEIIKL